MLNRKRMINILCISLVLSMFNTKLIAKEDNQIDTNETITENVDGFSLHGDVSEGTIDIQYQVWKTNGDMSDLEIGKANIENDKYSFFINYREHADEKEQLSLKIIGFDKNGGKTFEKEVTKQQILEKNTKDEQNITNESDRSTINEKDDNINKSPTYEADKKSKSDTNKIPTISNIKVGNVENGMYTIEATVEAEKGIDHVAFPTWTKNNGQDDIRWENGTISGNKVKYTVKLSDHGYESGTYITHIYAYDTSGTTKIIAVEKDVKSTIPSISNIKVGNVENGMYTIEATVEAEKGIDHVAFPTWTQNNGQDDIRWENGTVSGNKVKYTVKLSDHGYESGTYITHIYVYDKSGTTKTIAVEKDVKSTIPSISNIKVGNVENGMYTIEATVEADKGIDHVAFPTWTQNNGQDDIRWENGTVSGNKVKYTVKLSDHGYESGTYITHIYVYDKSGTTKTIAVEKDVKSTIPSISNIKVGNVENGMYTIEATVEADKGIDHVAFPTWTQNNGQDDIRWENGTVSGNKVKYTVKLSDHGYESGTYITHIYVYDKSGTTKTIAVEKNVNITKPKVDNLNIVNTSGSYSLNFDVSDDIGIEKVAVATWTAKDDQDDIRWETANVNHGKVSLTINASDHSFESGLYISHIYVYSKSGLYTLVPVYQQMEVPNIGAGWKIMNGKKYLFNNEGELVKGANKLVIDISEHNGDIDWLGVKKSGVDAVILRVGYGWNEDLESQRDKNFNKNADELERLGIPYGVYLFSYETSAKGAEREAQYTLDLIKGRKISLPIFYDLEYDKVIGNISSSTYVAMAKAYCEKIKSAGYTPGIYANLDYWNNKLNDSSLDVYMKWVAQYNTNNGLAGHCDYTKPYKLWQYTSVGTISGIKGSVDMNAWFE